MATEEGWDQDRALTITHEVDAVGQYTMTVSDTRTGKLQFAWQMELEYAVEVARGILNAALAAAGAGGD